MADVATIADAACAAVAFVNACKCTPMWVEQSSVQAKSVCAMLSKARPTNREVPMEPQMATPEGKRREVVHGGWNFWGVINIAIVFLISILRERFKKTQKIEMIN